MKERPILFNGDMVRAILAGQKTQTRRVLKDPLDKTGGQYCVEHANDDPNMLVHIHSPKCEGHCDYVCSYPCPYGQPGDRLWVKETFHKYYPSETWPEPKALYKADGITLCDKDSEGKKQRWTPSIHMPRILSRIVLEIINTRVERVQDITSDGTIAEGAYEVRKVGDDIAHATWTMGSQDWRYDTPRQAFAIAWDSLYAADGLGWDVNPWVWVVTFKPVEEACPKN